MRAVSVAEMDAQGHAPSTPVTASQQCLVGHLLRGRFRDTIAYGRSLGLTVEAHKGSADLAQRRWFVRAEGPWADMRRFLLALERLH